MFPCTLRRRAQDTTAHSHALAAPTSAETAVATPSTPSRPTTRTPPDSPLSQILHSPLPVVGMPPTRLVTTTATATTTEDVYTAAPLSPSDFVLPRQRQSMRGFGLPTSIANFVSFGSGNSTSGSLFGSHDLPATAATNSSNNSSESYSQFWTDDWDSSSSYLPLAHFDYSRRRSNSSASTYDSNSTTTSAMVLHPLQRRPTEPPEEIDLTLSSSESDASDDDEVDAIASTSTSSRPYHASSSGDGDVEIVQTRVSPAATGSGSSPGVVTDARYLTYTSVPPLQRKRRRTPTPSLPEDARVAGVDLEMFDGQRAGSTTVSMENNEVLERFKRALKCSICLDTIDDMTSTICGHVYCSKCIRLAIRVTAKCPLCQRRLRPTDIHPLYF